VKPLTLLFALEKDAMISPATLVQDEAIERQVSGSTWRPQNHDGQYLGEVSLRQALVHSRNVPAVLLAEHVGMAALAEFWRSLGLQGAGPLPSAALGAFEGTPMELAGAYTIFPGQGRWVQPRWVNDIRDATGQEVWDWPRNSVRHASAQAAFMATSVMQDVLESGTGSGAARFGISGEVAGKTGTTDEGMDAWFVGFVPDMVVAVWVGRDRGEPLGSSGARAALPIWARFVASAGLQGNFVVPSGLVSVSLCTESLQPAHDECTDVTSDWFRTGAVPRERCSVHGGLVSEVTDAVLSGWERIRSTLGLGSADPEPARRIRPRDSAPATE
jgi:membrane peptidoglycan carboxypeptidase